MSESDLTVGPNLDDSNQSTSSSANLDQTSAQGSNGHESDAANRETASPESEEWTGVFNFSKRQQQKSVCFHSVTSQSGEKKVTNGEPLFHYIYIYPQISFQINIIS